MKSLLATTLLALSLTPLAAQAKLYPGELARDRAEIREERRELRDAYRYGDRRDIRDAREDLYEARREYREDLRDGRRDYYRDRYYRPHYRDHAYYGLPRAYGPHRWVRHHRDALLINRYNGRVVRVIRGYYG
jgi:Ni/Co efflux regulator RcnB